MCIIDGNTIKEKIEGILYSYMFNENSGSFATYGNNIVHETILYFLDDDGEQHLFIPPSGKLMNAENINYVIITETFGTNRVRVKYLAKVEEYDENTKGESFKYGEKTLKEIFEINKNKKGEPDNYGIFITFTVKNVFVPIDDIIIENGDKCEYNHGNCILKRVKPQSMRIYCSNNENNDYYETLKALIGNNNWYKAKDDFKTVKDTILPENYRETTFFNMIGKENDELAFSNMFKYFFLAKPELLIKLFKQLNEQIELKDTIQVEREYKHIDIFITDGEKYIIIENKIKSEINYTNGKSQLQKYVEALIDEKISKDNIYCFLFKPDYHKFEDSELIIKADTVEKNYTPVNYSTIYRFFKDNESEFKNDNYFPFFLEAMVKHTNEIDTDIEDRMKARFINRINELNGKPKIFK